MKNLALQYPLHNRETKSTAHLRQGLTTVWWWYYIFIFEWRVFLMKTKIIFTEKGVKLCNTLYNITTPVVVGLRTQLMLMNEKTCTTLPSLSTLRNMDLPRFQYSSISKLRCLRAFLMISVSCLADFRGCKEYIVDKFQMTFAINVCD